MICKMAAICVLVLDYWLKMMEYGLVLLFRIQIWEADILVYSAEKL